MKVIESINGQIIPISDIVDVSIHAEQCTGDGEYDSIETWNVTVDTRWGNRVTVFEAPDFDCKKEWFYSMEAVRGENFRLARERESQIEQAMKDARGELEFL